VPAVDDLVRLLTQSTDPAVRRNSALALGKLRGDARNAVPALANALKVVPEAPTDSGRSQPYEQVREHAAEALAHIGYPANEAALPAIRECLLRENNSAVRQRCVWALFNCGKDLEKLDLVSAVTSVLEDKRKE